MRFPLADLRLWCEQLLREVGMRPADAAVLTESLLTADLRGVDTHGLVRLPVYVERMRRGVLKARPELATTRLGGAVAVVDADEGPGQLAGRRAMSEAIAIAQGVGAGVVTVRGSAHFGTAAWYTSYAAESGMVGLALSHAEADVVPFGGRRPALGTNPLSLAVPGPGGEPPVVLDMASSAVAMGRVLVARQEGVAIPPGWAVDADGKPTTDAHDAVAVLPLGGPKGFGLAVFIDILSALLTGAAFGTDIRRMYDDFDAPQRLGHVLIAIEIERFVPLAEFRTRLAALRDQIVGTPAAAGFERVMMPGQPEAEAERTNRHEGVPMSPTTVEELRLLADSVGIALPAEVASGRAADAG